MSSNNEKVDEKIEEPKETKKTTNKKQEKKETSKEKAKEEVKEVKEVEKEVEKTTEEVKPEEETVSCLNFTEIKIEENENKEENKVNEEETKEEAKEEAKVNEEETKVDEEKEKKVGCLNFSSNKKEIKEEIKEETKEKEKDVCEEVVEGETVIKDEVKYDESKLLNLGKLLGELIAEEAKMNELKINLKLNNEFIELMKKMNELYPDLLKEIDISLIDIIADKVIDSNDIPNLIVLVKNVYKKFSEQDKFKKLNKITLEDSINFIKNLILILIELGHIKVNDKEKVILIIDLCIDLLTSSMDLGQSLFQKLKNCLC